MILKLISDFIGIYNHIIFYLLLTLLIRTPSFIKKSSSVRHNKQHPELLVKSGLSRDTVFLIIGGSLICGSLGGLYVLTQDWWSTSEDTISNPDTTHYSTTLEEDLTHTNLSESVTDSTTPSEYESITSESLPFISAKSSSESSDDNLTIEPSREMSERTTQTEVPYIRVRLYREEEIQTNIEDIQSETVSENNPEELRPDLMRRFVSLARQISNLFGSEYGTESSVSTSSSTSVESTVPVNVPDRKSVV